jgi:hypothetical protein
MLTPKLSLRRKNVFAAYGEKINLAYLKPEEASHMLPKLPEKGK